MLTAFGYERFRVNLGYSWQENVSGVSADGLPLDVIAVAGCILVTALLQLSHDLNISYAIHALKLISNLEYFKQHVVPPEKQMTEKSTASKWRAHLNLLESWRVISWTCRAATKFINCYFAVAKSCGKLARAIFNGRAFSNECQKPPTVNLPDVAELLKAISDALVGRRFSFICADLRHWFFQFPLIDEIRSFFGMRIDDQFCRFNVLPMGFSFSPYIAQSIGWLIIIESLRRCDVDISSLQGATQLPSYIKLTENDEIIVIALWYDNLGFWCTSENRTMNFAKQFRATCADFNVVIKEINVYDTNEMELVGEREDPKDAFDDIPIVKTDTDSSKKSVAAYLGMEMGWRLVRINPRRVERRFEWRHALPRRVRWWKSIKTLPSTCRSIAHLVGIIVWHCHMKLEPLVYVKSTIDALRSSVKIKKTWDTADDAYRPTIDSLRSEVMRLCRDASWNFKQRFNIDKRFFVASDASSKKWGFLVYRSDFTVWMQDHSYFAGTLFQSKHIFVKELLAATLAIERICSELNENEQVEIFIAVDNTAAAAVLRRLYSLTEFGSELVLRVINALKGKHSLRVISIRSEDNPSDPLTRNRCLCPIRNSMFQNICKRFLYGIHITDNAKANPKRSHPERDEADDFSSDEEANEVDADCADILDASPEDDVVENDT